MRGQFWCGACTDACTDVWCPKLILLPSCRHLATSMLISCCALELRPVWHCALPPLTFSFPSPSFPPSLFPDSALIP
jgi:hypothetical protein